LVVFGFVTKPLTMIRLFAELFGHYLQFIVRSGTGGVVKSGLSKTGWDEFS